MAIINEKNTNQNGYITRTVLYFTSFIDIFGKSLQIRIIQYKHNTIKEVDEVLERIKPKNVVVILYDGMGFNILNKQCTKHSSLDVQN